MGSHDELKSGPLYRIMACLIRHGDGALRYVYRSRRDGGAGDLSWATATPPLRNFDDIDGWVGV